MIATDGRSALKLFILMCILYCQVPVISNTAKHTFLLNREKVPESGRWSQGVPSYSMDSVAEFACLFVFDYLIVWKVLGLRSEPCCLNAFIRVAVGVEIRFGLPPLSRRVVNSVPGYLCDGRTPHENTSRLSPTTPSPLMRTTPGCSSRLA